MRYLVLVFVVAAGLCLTFSGEVLRRIEAAPTAKPTAQTPPDLSEDAAPRPSDSPSTHDPYYRKKASEPQPAAESPTVDVDGCGECEGCCGKCRRSFCFGPRTSPLVLRLAWRCRSLFCSLTGCGPMSCCCGCGYRGNRPCGECGEHSVEIPTAPSHAVRQLEVQAKKTSRPEAESPAAKAETPSPKKESQREDLPLVPPLSRGKRPPFAPLPFEMSSYRAEAATSAAAKEQNATDAARDMRPPRTIPTEGADRLAAAITEQTKAISVQTAADKLPTSRRRPTSIAETGRTSPEREPTSTPSSAPPAADYVGRIQAMRLARPAVEAAPVEEIAAASLAAPADSLPPTPSVILTSRRTAQAYFSHPAPPPSAEPTPAAARAPSPHPTIAAAETRATEEKPGSSVQASSPESKADSLPVKPAAVPWTVSTSPPAPLTSSQALANKLPSESSATPAPPARFEAPAESATRQLSAPIATPSASPQPAPQSPTAVGPTGNLPPVTPAPGLPSTGSPPAGFSPTQAPKPIEGAPKENEHNGLRSVLIKRAAYLDGESAPAEVHIAASLPVDEAVRTTPQTAAAPQRMLIVLGKPAGETSVGKRPAASPAASSPNTPSDGAASVGGQDQWIQRGNLQLRFKSE